MPDADIQRVLSSLQQKIRSEAALDTPNSERCIDILNSIESTILPEGKGKTGKPIMSLIATLESSGLGKTLAKSLKAFRRHKRTDANFEPVFEKCNSLLEKLKEEAKQESKASAAANAKTIQADGLSDNGAVSFPPTVAVYRARLVKYKKELYKDPPVLPPRVEVYEERKPVPKRAKNGELIFEDHKDFRPNLTPEEVLRAGAFGGTYFRSIVSGVTNIHYKAEDAIKETLPDQWIAGMNKRQLLTSQSYNNSVNKFGVKCGGSLGMWESSGWISEIDPYGWFQWYCRFYEGRRSDDDLRQISRWAKSAGPRGRFRSQLCNKCIAANTNAREKSISPVIRQTLHHWGFELTPELLEWHRKNRKK
mmetsp:Transcript_8110/g.12035  ORF Transcript_8110/g.12035 Transcript_8110/m.12035 type:complete len:364 (+) Transcript_8110:103-1194(+)